MKHLYSVSAIVLIALLISGCKKSRPRVEYDGQAAAAVGVATSTLESGGKKPPLIYDDRE